MLRHLAGWVLLATILAMAGNLITKKQQNSIKAYQSVFYIVLSAIPTPKLPPMGFWRTMEQFFRPIKKLHQNRHWHGDWRVDICRWLLSVDPLVRLHRLEAPCALEHCLIYLRYWSVRGFRQSSCNWWTSLGIAHLCDHWCHDLLCDSSPWRTCCVVSCSWCILCILLAILRPCLGFCYGMGT